MFGMILRRSIASMALLALAIMPALAFTPASQNADIEIQLPSYLEGGFTTYQGFDRDMGSAIATNALSDIRCFRLKSRIRQSASRTTLMQTTP